MLLRTLLPTRCPGCGALGAAPSAACVAGLSLAHPGPVPTGLDACRSLLTYDGVGRSLVTHLKYRRDRAALGWLAAGMAALVAPPAGTIVTWAPTTAARRRQRGFDQAELLAARSPACGRSRATACCHAGRARRRPGGRSPTGEPVLCSSPGPGPGWRPRPPW